MENLTALRLCNQFIIGVRWVEFKCIMEPYVKDDGNLTSNIHDAAVAPSSGLNQDQMQQAIAYLNKQLRRKT